MTEAKLDSIDQQLIRLLLQDSSTPVSVLASYIGLHPSTISYRIRRLRRSGVIKKFTVSVDWRKMGKQVEAAFIFNCSPKDVHKIASLLTDYDEVIEVHSLTGFSDILAMITLNDMSEYKDFIENKLGNIPEIESFRAGIVLEDYKEE
jgi:DNA-binding Lrp family transcriptional regulator